MDYTCGEDVAEVTRVAMELLHVSPSLKTSFTTLHQKTLLTSQKLVLRLLIFIPRAT